MTNSQILETLKKILVVVDPGQVLPGKPEQSAVLRRALELARVSGCELELFHACHEPSLDLSLFADREEVNREREKVANRAATKMAEVALRFGSENIDVSHEVRWDHPPADAVLRKIADAKPDLVLKETRGPGYVVGLSDHCDWELIRKAPTPIWFVKPGDHALSTVLTAIGGTAVNEGLIAEADYEVFEVGNRVADLIGAKNQPVHSYEVPRIDAFATYAPATAGAANVAAEVEAWEEFARLHGEAIEKFARRFDIEAESVEISRGHPAEVVPQMAESLGTGLIVMGARNLGRWERFFSSVAAEPVLAKAPCDILFVKEKEGTEIPVSEQRPARGLPALNLEMAITHPEKAFRTPLAVAESEQLTESLRHRILDVWELDVQAQLDEEDEGGPVQPTQAEMLKEISMAKQALEKQAGRRAAPRL